MLIVAFFVVILSVLMLILVVSIYSLTFVKIDRFIIKRTYSHCPKMV